MYINFHIKVYVPKLIEWPFVAIVLWYRRKRYNVAFRRIKLTKGRYAIVDVEDYPKLAEYDWQLYESKSENLYAFRCENGEFIKMHRVILNAPAGVFVDHRYGDGLDNRKKNLRIVTRAQNQYNRRKTSGKTTSKYKGVFFYRKRNKYCAKIGCKGKNIHLGYFDNEADAARAYDQAAKIYHGEFARLNFENDSRQTCPAQAPPRASGEREGRESTKKKYIFKKLRLSAIAFGDGGCLCGY